jgi:hypothetical protein
VEAECSVVLNLVLQLTKGFLRDPKMRRSLMFYIMLVALVMLFFGWVFLSERWARENKWLYLGYWAVCAWLTLTAMLLAAFDILLIRAANRAKRRLMEAELVRGSGEPPEKP